MSGNFEVLTPATWCEDANGVPRSERYGDVYHSAGGALAQARHVFLQGNGLPDRWQGKEAFTLCETGFGLGQNFLAAWQAWRDDARRCSRLHYVGFEAHPFSVEDLWRAWRRLPQAVQPLACELAAAWPVLLPGLHRIELAGGALTLTLAFGRIERLARQVQACADAFFLDGFAPRVNPEMWSAAVFGQLRRLAAEGATAATWCSAGQVRRDLQDAGFLVSRAPGFGHKRDMTVAVVRPGLGQVRGAACPQHVAVIGAGLAGAGVAQSLALRGDQVEVWDAAWADRAAGSAMPAPAGALVPALSRDDDTRSRLSRAGLERARTRWAMLPAHARPDACGALVCAQDAAHAMHQRQALDCLQFPADWVCHQAPGLAQARAGVTLPWGGLWFAHALRADLPVLTAALLAASSAVIHPRAVAGLRPAPAGGWELLDATGGLLGRAAQVVLANARGAAALLRSAQPPTASPVLDQATPIAGSLNLYPAGEAADAVPRCILSGNGYCLPPRAGWGVAGSTYHIGTGATPPAQMERAAILARLHGGWMDTADIPWLGRDTPRMWSGWRLATRDHLPVIGAVPGRPGLWLACAYGSRGLSWSALAGDLIAARLHAEPVPLERELQRRIAVR